jgi:hypothetical protein
MKTSNYIIISFFVFLFGGIFVLFIAAKSHPETEKEALENLHVAFYTKNNSPQNRLSLFIDGNQIGLLPYLGENPNFDLISSKGLTLILKNGDHYIYAKDTTGTIVSALTINASNFKPDYKAIGSTSTTVVNGFFNKRMYIVLSH